MEQINIEKIMEEIRADIKAKGLVEDNLALNDVILYGGASGNAYTHDAYKDVVENALDKYYVESYKPVSGNFISKIIKKINRRLIAFYIEAIVIDQDEFNKEVANSIALNYSKFKEDDERMKALEAKIFELQKKIESLEK